MSDDRRKVSNEAIYKYFCDGMKNQSRDQIRIAGDVARLATKNYHSSGSIESTISNFSQIESQLENIENNLNKVCCLTRQTK